MAILNTINLMKTAMEGIRTALNNKGVDATGHKLGDFAGDIDAIKGGEALVSYQGLRDCASYSSGWYTWTTALTNAITSDSVGIVDDMNTINNILRELVRDNLRVDSEGSGYTAVSTATTIPSAVNGMEIHLHGRLPGYSTGDSDYNVDATIEYDGVKTDEKVWMTTEYGGEDIKVRLYRNDAGYIAMDIGYNLSEMMFGAEASLSAEILYNGKTAAEMSGMPSGFSAPAPADKLPRRNCIAIYNIEAISYTMLDSISNPIVDYTGEGEYIFYHTDGRVALRLNVGASETSFEISEELRQNVKSNAAKIQWAVKVGG